jgi:DNA-binding GntR family transcriptional regulator
MEAKDNPRSVVNESSTEPQNQSWENEGIHDELRKAILRNELPAGMTLNQVHLAKRFGVSRTPLREALRKLQREGLIEGESNKRMRVTSLSVSGLEDLYAMRILLEGLAVRMTVPKLTDEDFSQLKRSLSEMKSASEAQAYEAWEVPNQSFHRRLVRYAGERQQCEMRELADHAKRYRRAYTTGTPWAWVRGIKEHQEILDACIQRNPYLAAERLTRHYSSVVLGLLGTLAPEHEPVAVRTATRMVLCDFAPGTSSGC